MIRNFQVDEYSEKYLEIDRPSPMSDDVVESVIQEVLSGKIDKDISDNVYVAFKQYAHKWIFGTKLNKFSGIESFQHIDIINGCTQFIDNLYMQGPLQTIQGDYRYHQRLNLCDIRNIGNLENGVPLIIAMPFPNVGDVHIRMKEILQECHMKNIDVHIDGAWITCCKKIEFDFSHPAIKSVGISLSKGLGLGWNRIGLRYSRNQLQDSISIMNNFNMNNRALVMIGLHFIKKFPSDYFWNTYGTVYDKICKDFDLTPTNAIHLAMKNDSPVGISGLIRYASKQ